MEAVITAAHSVSYPIALYVDTAISTFDEPESLPVTYTIDRTGFARAILSEAITEATRERFVTPLLSITTTGP